MFLASPRNSVDAQINPLDRLKCKTVISPNPRPPPVTAILVAHKLRVLEIPSVQELLSKKNRPFPFGANFVKVSSNPLFIMYVDLHSHHSVS